MTKRALEMPQESQKVDNTGGDSKSICVAHFRYSTVLISTCIQTSDLHSQGMTPHALASHQVSEGLKGFLTLTTNICPVRQILGSSEEMQRLCTGIVANVPFDVSMDAALAEMEMVIYQVAETAMQASNIKPSDVRGTCTKDFNDLCCV